MERQSFVEFFRLDGRKTVLSFAFICIGFFTALIYLWMLLFHLPLLGESPNPIFFGMISMLSPLFGLSITYIYAFKTIPVALAVAINLLLVLQFFHWYYMACLAVYINDKLFKGNEVEFYK